MGLIHDVIIADSTALLVIGGASLATRGLPPPGPVQAVTETTETVAESGFKGGEASSPEPIPGDPFRGADAPERAYEHLAKEHGLDPNVARNRLHILKDQGGLGATDPVVIGRTGDVYNAATGERLGSLTDRLLGRER